MGMKGRRILVVLSAVTLVAVVSATAALGARKADPGITSTSISIGGTFPLTGVASLYKTIPAAEAAYFAYVNDHGGVNGRKINFTILDDAYDPSKTVPLTQQLVEQNKVFAIFGSLGTAPNLAIWSYLNTNKVPQVLIATGDSYWGFSYKKYPWTIGYQPDYPGEGKIYGKYIAQKMPNAKIGVLYQNDAYGKNYYAGLRVGLGAKKSQHRQRPVLRRDADEPRAADPRAEGSRRRHVRRLRDAVADDHGARHGDEGRLDPDDVHQQRLGEPPVPAGGRGKRGERRRGDLLDLPRQPDVRTAGEHHGRQARERRSSPSTHRRSQSSLAGRRLERRLRARRGVDVRPGAQERGEEPDAGEPDEGAEEPQRRRPVHAIRGSRSRRRRRTTSRSSRRS